MRIQVNTDRQLDGSAELITQVEATLEGALSRFSIRITRVEVHLSDENGSQKSGSRDKRCVLEARLTGMKPIKVSADGSSHKQALNDAANNLEKLLGRTLDRLDNHSHNPFLMANGIEKNPDALSGDQLCKEAWHVIEPHVALQLSKRNEDFQTAQSQHLGASDLTDIAQALIAGRVGVLMVEADRQIPGKLDHVSGAIQFLNLDATDTDDLLDDFAELTLKMGGEVAIVSSETLPSNSGAAAIYRY